jgi:hypothetical protein
MGLGTSVWNIGVGKYFALTASTAGLVTDQVVAVLGLVGVRWILSTAIPAAGSVTYAMMDPTMQGTYLPSDSLVTLGAEGQDLTISGLNGNVDGDYLVNFYLDGSVHNPGVISLRPNGLTTNQLGSGIVIYPGGPFMDTGAIMEMIGSAGTQTFQGQFCFTSKTGRPRFLTGSVNSNRSGDLQTNFFSGVWTDTTTNVTSLVIHCANANGFEATTTLARVRKLHNII